VFKRCGVIAPAVHDPAIGVLERGDIHATQTPRDAEGALKACGIIIMRGQKAREVVGNNHIAAVVGIKLLINRNCALQMQETI